MKGITIRQIEKATGGRLIGGETGGLAHGVSTDSRTIGPGDVFFALRGEQFDGHDFLRQAMEKGARHFVISDPASLGGGEGVCAVLVEDTEKALRDLAGWYLSTLALKKVGITGSTGKTSTKDILHAICGEKFKTGKTPGNLNTTVGVPLTIFGFEEGAEVGVIEMGAETIGEIHALAEIVKPDIGIITNIGVSHIETFGSRENIAKGKMEITDFFGKDSLLIVYGENAFLEKESVAGDYRLETIGESGKSDYILSDIDDSDEKGVVFTLEKSLERRRFETGLPGRHNAINAALAVAAAMDLGMSMEETAVGLRKAALTEKRLGIKGKGGLKVIDDTYNASPDSMRAGIDVLMATKGMRKVAILGDMLELGGMSAAYHEEIGEYAAARGADLLIGVGPLSENIVEAASRHMAAGSALHFKRKEALLTELHKLIKPGDVILVKGSRGMAMERIVKKIME